MRHGNPGPRRPHRSRPPRSDAGVAVRPASADNARAMQQPAVDNRTDFAVHPQLLLDAEGERLVVIVKATYELDGGKVVVAPRKRTRPVRFADVPKGNEE